MYFYRGFIDNKNKIFYYKRKLNADIAQLVEQCIRNTWVAGSNPVISSSYGNV